MSTTDGSPIVSDLGPRLSQIRRARNRTLAEVASATGISASFLSTVEKGKSDISMGRLMRLVRYYGISITDLVDEGGMNFVHVVRPDERRVLRLAKEGISLFVLAPEGNHAMMPVLNEYAAGGGMADAASHEGEEFVYVIDGSIELTIGDEGPILLNAGDSAFYNAPTPHRFRNIGDVSARFIGVATPPNL